MNYVVALRRLSALGGILLFVLAASVANAKEPPGFLVRSNAVGRVGLNRYLTPTGQWLTPAGRQIELSGMRPQTLALSPDGRLLVTAGRTNYMAVIDLAAGRVRQKAPLSSRKVEVKLEPAATELEDGMDELEDPEENFEMPQEKPVNTNKPPSTTAQMSFTGLAFAPDGKRIYLANAAGTVRAFTLGEDSLVNVPVSWAVPDTKPQRGKKEIPTGMAVSADGRKIYVLGNLANKLHEMETAKGKVLRSWDTGVAPYDIVLVGNKAYVCNLGGRRPDTTTLTAPAGKDTKVRVDPVRHIPNEGSVTVVNLANGRVKTEIMVELHPSALAVSPNKKYVVVANTGSDTLSVIDTKTDRVVEKIWARQTPADLFGAQPNALAFHPNGKRLFVCNGTQNAVAVVEFEPEDNASKVIGLIPVGWFPGAVVFDASRQTLCVANIKGIGATRIFKPDDKIKLSTKNFFGTVSLIPMPSDKELAAMTELALLNMRYPRLAEAKLPPRAGQPARPVPERVGEPSVFKHVIYVIKENRSYDQVLGDMPEGNGDTNLCTFGEKVTPNQHKIAREFILLDNTYCAGVQSADGHQWTDSAIANEYVERQLTANWPRSYPGGKVEDGIDALAWSSSGFIWDHALKHGKTFRNYGEWMISKAGWQDKNRKDKITWRDFWNDYAHGSNQTRLASKPAIETLRALSPTNTVGWDLHVPDVMRAAFFIKELKQFEANGGFPNFTLLFLPNDHTGGARDRYPTPASQIADNDLAFGQVVEAVSHSKFWAETCIFAIEDDPQAGWDHVSGYRTTCYIASPYTKRRQTISKQYNHLSLMRTMELILGLPPMNQMDATATPMTDCFMDTPDLTPFASVPNTTPLDRINQPRKKITDATLRQDAIVSDRLPLDEMDKCPEDVLNRILWRSVKGPHVPYPEWAVKAVADND